MVAQSSLCFLVSGVEHADKKRFKLLDSKGRSHAAAYGRARNKARNDTGAYTGYGSKKSSVRQIRPRITHEIEPRDNLGECEPTGTDLEDDAYPTGEANSQSDRPVKVSQELQYMRSRFAPACPQPRFRSGLDDISYWTWNTRLPKQLSKSSLDPFFRPAIDLSIADQHLLQSCA
jgi:hypothetical protein